MKLAMKPEAQEKLNRLANEMTIGEAQPVPSTTGVLTQFWHSFVENAKEWILESVQML
jgi:hypothetical protein